MAESFLAALENERVNRTVYPTRQHAPAFYGLRAYFEDHLGPALRILLDKAVPPTRSETESTLLTCSVRFRTSAPPAGQ